MKKLAVAVLALTGLSGISGIAEAHNAGEFFLRAGSATVRTNVRSDAILNKHFDANNNTQLGLTLNYMVTDNLGVELLAASPFRHKVSLTGVGNIATIHDLPPSLMAQWYFGGAQSQIRPYVGVGINYTNFFNNHFNENKTVTDLKLNGLKLTDSWGVASQVGVDYLINKNWLLNMSVWYVDIKTKVKFKADTTPIEVNTRIDPWVFMFSAGYRF